MTEEDAIDIAAQLLYRTPLATYGLVGATR
jgi:hypothetical protein